MQHPSVLSATVSSCLGIAGSLVLAACVGKTDSNEPNMTLSYANRTDRYLEMIILGAAGDTVPGPIELEPDSMRGVSRTPEFWLNPTYHERIVVGRASEGCLEFEGPIEDTARDPRSEAAYARFETFIYSYTFRNEVVAMAGPCAPSRLRGPAGAISPDLAMDDGEGCAALAGSVQPRGSHPTHGVRCAQLGLIAALDLVRLSATLALACRASSTPGAMLRACRPRSSPATGNPSTAPGTGDRETHLLDAAPSSHRSTLHDLWSVPAVARMLSFNRCPCIPWTLFSCSSRPRPRPYAIAPQHSTAHSSTPRFCRNTARPCATTSSRR